MSWNPISLLQELIRIPSVNPDNEPGTEKVGEKALTDFLHPLLSEMGFSVHTEEVMPGRPNLIARCPGDRSRERILLCPHSDTVGVGNMTINPFGGELEDGKVWGRGSTDTKGSMAAMLAGLYAHRKDLSSMPIAIDFVAFMGEESGQHGSKNFARKYSQNYSFAIAGEPTMLDIVYLTKGSLWLTLQCTGTAAHSSQPHLGRNAILKMLHSLNLLNRQLSDRLANYSHPILGHSTLNIGLISGGSRPNIVPDLCSAELDIRLTPDLEQDGGALHMVESVINEHNLPISIISSAANPPMQCPSEHKIISLIQKARKHSKLVGAPWFSDAAHLSYAGIPSIAFGPGSIDQAHTKNEFIRVADFLEGVAFFETFIGQFNA